MPNGESIRQDLTKLHYTEELHDFDYRTCCSLALSHCRVLSISLSLSLSFFLSFSYFFSSNFQVFQRKKKATKKKRIRAGGNFKELMLIISSSIFCRENLHNRFLQLFAKFKYLILKFKLALCGRVGVGQCDQIG